MDDFISEQITPLRGSFASAAMGQGLPGVPTGFTWRGQSFQVRAVVQAWKQSAAWDHRQGSKYLRRHWFRLAMGNGEDWVVYFIRTAGRGGAGRKWYLLRTCAPQASAGA